MRILFLKLFLFALIMASASAYCSSVEKNNFKISFPKYVQISDSANIIIDMATESFTDYSFKWETSFGSILPSGNKAVFLSPEFPGEAIIKLDIYYKNELTTTYSFRISVFRQLIVLKADDLIYDKNKVISENWTRFLHYVVSEKIKTSVGLIVNSLEVKDEKYPGLLKYLNRTGFVELWIHGYDHRLGAVYQNGELYDEFRNSSLEFQKEQIRKALELSKLKLDFTMHTFGAPGNAIDSNTIDALDSFDEIKVWFFGLEGSQKLVLGRSADMEYPVGNPDYESFIKNHDLTKRYIVFQIHPNMWDENQFIEFKKIISYLKEQKLTFILPHEYYKINVTEPIN